MLRDTIIRMIKYVISGIVVICLVAGFLIYSNSQIETPFDNLEPANSGTLGYIVPENFVSGIDNPYLTYEPGTTFIYKVKDSREDEEIRIEVTDRTKEVLGVTAIVVVDSDWEAGELVESTEGLFAQDIDGNVWILAEQSIEYEDGVIVDEDIWSTGVDGALPGIVMKADPLPGDIYLNEYYKDLNEAGVGILSLDASASTPHGSFTDCLKVRDWSPQDPHEIEYKYYCKEVSTLVLDETEDSDYREELTEVIR